MTKINVENITHTDALPDKRELIALEEISLDVEKGERTCQAK